MDRARMRHHFPSVAFVVIAAIALIIAAAGFIYFGVYNIAADDPHTRPVYSMLESLRDRSIAVHSQNIAAPANLSDPKRISSGAALYTEMCSGCHLGPGVERSEMSQGLYPQAPELAKTTDLSPAEQFWIIKHGIKMTAMPAWGKTHDDRLIWDMVAFVRKLPGLSPAQYQAITQNAPMDHDAMMKGMTEAEGASQKPSGAGEHAGH